MIAAIQSKLINSVSPWMVSAFHVLNQPAATGIFNGGNPELLNVALLIILIHTGVSVVGNFTRVPAFGKITSATPLS